ncbi:DUF4430 domain-containing protein [Bacillus massilinigeriensis]|uniref:DUF4430 domain-containing protein n=1 Tax=Bacillus mediterraneensis TaxID=1805474 RepID=UPI0008F8202D|nr:DUF4430 domain-containing protein [Bacillus mediterraneensis]
MARLGKALLLAMSLVLMFSMIGCNFGSEETKSSTVQEEKTAKKETKQEKATEKKDQGKEKSKENATKEDKEKKAEDKKGEKEAEGEASADKKVETKKGKQAETAFSNQPKQQASAPSRSSGKTADSSVKKEEPKAPAAAPSKPAPAPAPAPAPEKPAPAPVQKQEVTVSVIGPKGKLLMAPKSVEIGNSDTVLDTLIKGAGSGNIDYSGSGATAYVEGIFNIYEFDYGPKSGWTVYQNGALIPKSAGVITVKDGDRIVWKYTE